MLMLDRRQLLILLAAQHPVNIPFTDVRLETRTKRIGVIVLYVLTTIYAK
jgi:hypothetical protein